MSGVGPFYININNVTFGKKWTVPKIDPFLWTAGKVLVTREEEFAVELVGIDSSPIGGATGGQIYQASVRVNSHYSYKQL